MADKMIDKSTNKYCIGFTRSGVHPDNVLAYKKRIYTYGFDVFGICEDLNEKKQYDSSINVFCLEEWLERKWNSFDITKLRSYQEKYTDYNLWEVYYTDRYIRYKYSYEDATRVLIGMITFWEDLLSKTNAAYILSDCIIGANNFIGMIVGKKAGTSFISMASGRYKKYFSFFSTGEGYINDRLVDLINKKVDLSDDDMEKAEKYVQDYICNKRRPAYIDAGVNANKQLGKTVLFYLKRIKNVSYLWDKKFDNKYNIHLYKGKKQTLLPIAEAMRKQIISIYFQEPNYSEDYILFPLHFQPEASTCVYARKYENQSFFIEQLSKSIPVEKILYVKEHSVRQGHRPLSFYRQLKKYPNVKLISPNSDNHKLIKHSSFLICLTSTMGFEALMYGKPVFICGNCFFEKFSGAQKIYDVFDEKEKFLNPPKQDRKLYVRQMAYYLKSLQFCTMQEEPLHEETQENLIAIQNNTIDEVIKFINFLEG